MNELDSRPNSPNFKPKKKSLQILGKQISIAQLHFTATFFLKLFKSLNSYLSFKRKNYFLMGLGKLTILNYL